MQIYSAPGITFAAIQPAQDPPSLVTGLSLADLKSAFIAFATLAEGQVADSLSKAMCSAFVDGVKHAVNVPSADPMSDLYFAIRTKYQALVGDPAKQNEFNLYLYIALHHFVCWYARQKASDVVAQVRYLNSTIRDYVKGRLSGRLYQTDIAIDPAFFETSQFKDAFAVDGTLQDMVGSTRLGDVADRTLLGSHAFLTRRGSRLGLFEGRTARAVKREFVQAFRQAISDMVIHEVRRFLAKLNTPSTPTGLILAKGYGEYRQFGLGDGSGTKGMFGIADYGLLFFDYSLNDLSDPDKPCNDTIADVSLIDERDPPGTTACLLYYGLNFDFTGRPKEAPRIEVFASDSGVKRHAVAAEYEALAPGAHQLARASGPPMTFASAMQLPAFDATALIANLKSSSPANPSEGPEEMIYIVFKHRIGATQLTQQSQQLPVKQPAIKLSTEWPLVDNEYKKSPAEQAALVFAGQSAKLSALVTALEGDSAFEIYSDIAGLGVGRVRDGVVPGSGEIQLERAKDQSDKPLPAKPSYEALRYAHGQVQWYPDTATGAGGWLLFYVKAFVSPLRCTLEEKLTAAPLQALQSEIKPYLPKDGQGRRSYNCALSALRAFFLFEAMIKMIRAEALTSSQFQRINNALTQHLDNEAQVKILLPNNVYISRPPLKWADLDPFK